MNKDKYRSIGKTNALFPRIHRAQRRVDALYPPSRLRTIPADRFPRANQHNSTWQRARVEAGLPHLRVHDLRHMMGMRLREAGVPESTIADILWHTHMGMTAHYSVAQTQEIFDALERITNESQRGNRTLAMIAREARGV